MTDRWSMLIFQFVFLNIIAKPPSLVFIPIWQAGSRRQRLHLLTLSLLQMSISFIILFFLICYQCYDTFTFHMSIHPRLESRLSEVKQCWVISCHSDRLQLVGANSVTIVKLIKYLTHCKQSNILSVLSAPECKLCICSISKASTSVCVCVY